MGMKELCKESKSNPTERHSFFVVNYLLITYLTIE